VTQECRETEKERQRGKEKKREKERERERERGLIIDVMLLYRAKHVR
jgi:hypothetical protein